MPNKKPELIPKEVLRNLSKDQLVQEIEQAKSETIKYVNKFLEAEEKWTFINVLLKKLNSIRKKQELCETICEGFLKLTNSKICAFCLFNQDKNEIEFKQISFDDPQINQTEIYNFTENINTNCWHLIENLTDIAKISEYFDSISSNNLIALPVIYQKNFLGYLCLIKEDANFYKTNIHFINIFPEHIALILENISLYQESEKQNKRKMEFLAGISHEFKTPLNSIIGFSEIIKTRTTSIQDYKYIENILQSSTHLLTLIDDILDVTKSQFKSLELNYTTFKPKDIITQIIIALETMCKEKNLDLQYTLADVKISADTKRFKQLIYNLLTNAIKFNKQGGKINILSYIKDDQFFFEIEDTGDGISKKDYDKIFDFFSQVNRSQLKRELGSGIGLALCKRITEAHRGQIDFKSQFKKGSCFWFGLPLKKP